MEAAFHYGSKNIKKVTASFYLTVQSCNIYICEFISCNFDFFRTLSLHPTILIFKFIFHRKNLKSQKKRDRIVRHKLQEKVRFVRLKSYNKQLTFFSPVAETPPKYKTCILKTSIFFKSFKFKGNQNRTGLKKYIKQTLLIVAFDTFIIHTEH